MIPQLSASFLDKWGTMSYVALKPLSPHQVPRDLASLQGSQGGRVYETSLGHLYIFKTGQILENQEGPGHIVCLYGTNGDSFRATLLFRSDNITSLHSNLPPSCEVSLLHGSGEYALLPNTPYPSDPGDILKLGVDLFLQIDDRGDLIAMKKEEDEVLEADSFLIGGREIGMREDSISAEDVTWVSIQGGHLIFHLDQMPREWVILQYRKDGGVVPIGNQSLKNGEVPRRPIKYLLSKSEGLSFALDFGGDRFSFKIQQGKLTPP